MRAPSSAEGRSRRGSRAAIAEGHNKKAGSNANSNFALAPTAASMNLCNLHFREGGEHVSPGPLGFSIAAGGGGGAKCSLAATQAELTAASTSGCQGVKPGDTIEVHWVFSSCNVKPGPGLGSCVVGGQDCQLRVESQVFLLVKSSGANFGNFNYTGGVDGQGTAPAQGAAANRWGASRLSRLDDQCGLRQLKQMLSAESHLERAAGMCHARYHLAERLVQEQRVQRMQWARSALYRE